mgnify:CR=1 FL=1
MFFLVGYSPLGSLLPQASLSKKTQIIDLMVKVDSLEQTLYLKGRYVNALRSVLSGEDVDSVIPALNDTSFLLNDLKLLPSKEDSALRLLVEKEDLFNIPIKKKETNILQDFVFFKPAEGLITNEFNLPEKHYGVDLACHSGASVKACLDGVVIFADWSVSLGNTLIIQHVNNIVSLYMHNSILTKNVNELVLSGEVIGVVGDSGESSSGPHLHFELWQDGVPINPLEYIDF